MSLAEIPQNHIRRNGQLSQSSVAQRESRSHVGMPNGDKNAEILRKPSSIQSMLRNTTETGDVGQFSIKPPRVTTSSPRVSPASNKVRATLSKRRQPAPYYNEHHGYNGQHGAESPRQGSTTSNGSGFHGQGRRGPHRTPSFEDNQSYSMTQGSYKSHALNSRHPYANGHNRSRADVHNNRPHSPFAYPTRLKRPGYRPSSPALSELNRSMAGYGQGPVHDPSSRTTSPSSAYNANRTPSPFRYVVDRSDPNLQHYPPYLGTEPGRNRSLSTSSTRPSTPKPSASLRSKASSTRLQRKKSVTNGTWLHPQSSPVSPIFYDYTEEFEDQDSYANTSMPSRVLAEQPVPQIESSTYSEIGESPDSTGIAELPSEASPRKTHSEHYEPAFNQSTLEIDMVDDGFTQTAPQDLSDVPELPEKEMAATEAELPLKRTQHRWYEKSTIRSLPRSMSLPAVDTVQQLLPANEDRFRQSPQELAADLIAAGVSRTSKRDSSSPIGSMFSADSAVPSEPKPTTPELNHNTSAALQSQLKPETPKNDGYHGFTPAEVDRMCPLESSRGPSFEGHSRVSTEILSPTPERSIVSPSSRDRFSKILSIEEGPLNLDMLVPPVSKDERIDSPMQGNHSSHIGQNKTPGPLWRNGSLYLRASPLKQSLASNSMAEKLESDSEEEPELTVALRQTFCKGGDDSLEQRTTSSPITLPSQLAGQRLSPIVTVRRSSAIRRSVTKLPTQPNEQYPVLGGDFEPAQSSITQATPEIPMERAFAVDKELSQLPRKQVSLKSFSPATKPISFELPFDFIPLIHRNSEEDSVADLEIIPNLTPQQKGPISEEGADQMSGSIPLVQFSGNSIQPNGLMRDEEMDQTSALNREVQDKRDSAISPHASVGSRPGSRPWNLDSSYPWNDQLPELEVTMPQPAIDSQRPVEKAPRFKFKIHRASSSTGGTCKPKKELLPSEFSGTPSSSHDLIIGPAFRRKRNPNLSVFPGQVNSSHDIVQSSRQKTRFVETFETQSPTISLQAPSPGYEVRSFFSDDSSQIRPKPSFIKRFSSHRARAVAARATATDETRSYDRGLLSSALGRSRASGRSSRQSRNTGRSSRQSQYTAGPSLRSSHARRTHWGMMHKIRTWLQRGEGRVRGLGWRMGYRRGKNRSASTPLYAGV